MEECKEMKYLISSNVDRLERAIDNVCLKNKYIPSDKLEKNKDKIIHRTDIESYVQLKEGTSDTIFFNLPLLSGRELDNYEEIYNIKIKQRVYKGISDYIVNDTNYIINEHPYLMYKLISLSVKTIKNPKEYTEEEFFKDIQDILENQDLRNTVMTLIEDSYDISLDKNNEENKNKNIKKDLQVTDLINKSFLASGVLQRFIVTFVDHYYVVTNNHVCERPEESKDRTLKGIDRIFNYALSITSRDYNVSNNNKLYKIVEPKVYKTQYNDRVIWNYLDVRSVDSIMVINEIMNKIKTQIICKSIVNTSSVSFFTSVIKFSLEYVFKANYVVKYKLMNLVAEDEDEENNLDRHQINNYHKINETLELANTITIDRFIKSKIKELEISNEYIERMSSEFDVLNEVQMYLLRVYFAPYFTLNLSMISKKHIIALMIIMTKELINNNMETLGKVISSKIITKTKAKNVGKISLDVIADKHYIEALRNYVYLGNITEKDNFILRIALINGNIFKFIGEFEDEIIDDIDKKYFISEVSQFIANY